MTYHVSKSRTAYSEMKLSKYRSRWTVVDGQKFQSAKEARRWTDLQLMQRAGLIRCLERQVVYRLEIDGTLICKFVADFTYEEQLAGDAHWTAVCEDVKGLRTPVYRIKAKLMRALHGIEIREI